MSATILLSCADPLLAEAWRRQLPHAPEMVPEALLEGLLQRSGPRVWIKDLSSRDANAPAHPDTVQVVVGEPRSIPFEEAKLSGRASYYLSYDDSLKQLAQIVPMACELAMARASMSLLDERSRRTTSQPPFPQEAPLRRAPVTFDFVEQAVENLEDRTRIIDEFRRGVRMHLRSSKVSVFLREGHSFAAKSDAKECPTTDPVVFWLQDHLSVLDEESLSGVEKPADEAHIRARMRDWHARFVVPAELHGVLTGWVTIGPRADGRPFSPADREEAVELVRLLSRMLGQNARLKEALNAQQEARLVQMNGPRSTIIRFGEKSELPLPVEVREVASAARRDGKKVVREFGKRRVSAGPLPGMDACWVVWEETEGLETAERAKEMERYQNLHDVGIMLSHELSNRLLSVHTFYQHLRDRVADSEETKKMTRVVDMDMKRLKDMPHILGALHQMAKEPTAAINMRRLVESVGEQLNAETDVTAANECVIHGHEANIRDAILWLCQAILEQSEGERATGKLRITLQQRRRDGDVICLITIAYPGLRISELRVGEPRSVDEFPTVPIYLAREIVRFHYGTVDVGSGMDGQELQIALKSRQNAFKRPSGEHLAKTVSIQTGLPVKSDGADSLPASA